MLRMNASVSGMRINEGRERREERGGRIKDKERKQEMG